MTLRIIFVLAVVLSPVNFGCSFSQRKIVNITTGRLALLRATTNQRYFMDSNGRAIYLTGRSGCPFNQQDGWGTTPPSADQLVAGNENLCRSWVWENSRWRIITAANNAQVNGLINPFPFKRTGPGVALDEQPKFNLNTFDQNFFDRLRNGVVAAGEKGIYVQVMLFQGWSARNDEGTNPWFGHYYNVNNNVNGINGDLNGDGDGREIFTLNNPSVTTLQDAYVRKMIDTLNDLDNVIWEIANEVPGDLATNKWQYRMIDLVKSYEATKAKQHPVGMSPGSPDLKTLTSSVADWVAPGATTFNSNTEPYNSNPPATTGNKVFILDSDHLGYSVWNDVNFSLRWIWKSFTRGYNVLAQELSNNSAAQVIGYTNVYAKKMNLSAMTPQGSLSSTGYALANPGNEYLVYQPESGAFSVHLSSGNYHVEWLNPTTGAIRGDTSVSGGSAHIFMPPFMGQAVLYLLRQPL